MASSPPSDDIYDRLERIKSLSDELERAQQDSRRFKEIIRSIEAEAKAFRQTLGTHDPKPKA